MQSPGASHAQVPHEPRHQALDGFKFLSGQVRKIFVTQYLPAAESHRHLEDRRFVSRRCITRSLVRLISIWIAQGRGCKGGSLEAAFFAQGSQI